MNIDIQIYIKSLRDFFENHEGKEELLSNFPGVEFEGFMEQIEKLASHNYDMSGDPSVSKKQLLDILQILHAEVMRDGLQELIYSKEIDIKKDLQGIPQVRLTPEFKKELKNFKIFQLSTVGPICLN